MKYVFLLLVIMFLNSCVRSAGEQPSVIVIGIEKLSGQDFSCNSFNEYEKSGFKQICEEGVRFTHAFTPSIMSQAAVGGIVTGLHPYVNGLRDNGETFLSAKIKTVPENLIAKGIKTLFVVSFPTIKRYSRLHQGFEKFDDDFIFQQNKNYRPTKEVFEIFDQWYNDDVHSGPFFAFLHLSNLLFPLNETQNELGETRPLGAEGQLEDLDEALFKYFNHLKTKNLWDKNYIILLSLNGKSGPEKPSEIPSTNLYSENTNVILFIKPPKGREETPHQWKVDEAVSLIDLGPTISEIFSQKLSADDIEPYLKGESLLPFILKNKNTISKDRLILTESAWPKWSDMGNIRYSIRKNNWVYFHDEKPFFVNDLTDRNEHNRLRDFNAVDPEFTQEIHSLIEKLQLAQWKMKDKGFIEGISLLYQHALLPKINNEVELSEQLIRILKKGNISPQFGRFILAELIKRKKWEKLEEANKYINDLIIEDFLNYLADAKSNHEFGFKSPCMGYLIQNKDEFKNHCKMEDMLTLAEYFYSIGAEKENLALKINKKLNIYNIKKHIKSINTSIGASLIGKNSYSDEDIILELIYKVPKFQKDLLSLEKIK